AVVRELVRVDEGRRDRDGIVVVAAHRARPRLRVVGQAIARTEDRLVVEPVDAAHSRSEVVEAYFHPVGLRVAASPGYDDIKRGEIEPIEAAPIRAMHDRVELPAQPEVERELRARGPPVAEVKRV